MRRILPVLAALLLACPAAAQRSLTMVEMAPTTSLDPHFHSSIPNNMTLRQIYEALVDFDVNLNLRPGLAESWRAVDDRTWEFTLRQGVRFHDGTPLTADDVAFSYARVPTVQNSPGAFTPFVRSIADIEVVDGRTLRIRTRDTNPFLDGDLSNVMILSRTLHANATTAEMTSGRAAIGTGPYRVVSHTLNDRLELAANRDHWGGAPPWDRVLIRYVTNNGARTVTLLSGEVDLIEGVYVQDVPRLQADPRIAVFAADSVTVAYLFPDSVRDTAPGVTDRNGQPIPNPLRDRRVREALSLSINRAGIVERLLAGQGVPAEQFAAPVVQDRIPDRPPIPFAPDRARRMLAEAGYPDGFRMTIHGPTGFFPADDNVLQGVAQGFTRIGVETTVQVLPPTNFFPRATNREFALFLTTFTSNTALNTLRQVVATRDDGASQGPFNRQRYTSPGVDVPLAEALRTMDQGRRIELVRGAMRVAMDDLAVIPVFTLRNIWAGRRDRVTYDANSVGYTSALYARPVN